MSDPEVTAPAEPEVAADAPVFEARGLTKRYTRPDGRVLTACRGVSLRMRAGETLGVVGESGCGKSTLLRMLSQLERPDEGQLLLHGQDVTGLSGERLRRMRPHVQMVFQDPSTAFFGRMRAGDAVAEPLRNFGRASGSALKERVRDLFEQVGLPPEMAERYPHSMSGGQRQRLGLARALALEPDVLLCDEATSALDVSTQQQIVELLADIQRRCNLSILFVGHDLALVASVSHRIMVMYLGGVVEVMPSAGLVGHARHPYTRALLDSVFTVDTDPARRIAPLAGEVPSPIDAPSGCAFHTRCPSCDAACEGSAPELVEIEPGHLVACHHVV